MGSPWQQFSVFMMLPYTTQEGEILHKHLFVLPRNSLNKAASFIQGNLICLDILQRTAWEGSPASLISWTHVGWTGYLWVGVQRHYHVDIKQLMSTIFIFYISIYVFTNFLLLLLTFVHRYFLFKNSLITLVLRHLLPCMHWEQWTLTCHTTLW